MTTFPWSRRTTAYTDKGYRIAQGYVCPECGTKSRVVDSRDASVGIRRRRVCTGNELHRFTTYEMTEAQVRSMSDTPTLERVAEILLRALSEINSIRRRAAFKAVPSEMEHEAPTGEPRRRMRRQT